MAVPQRRLARSRTRSRRAQWKAEPVDLVPIVIGGRTRWVPGRLVGYYRRHPEQLDR